MEYVLLCPKGSIKDLEELIKKLNGFWNGIGYAFPPETKPLVEAWFRSRALYIVNVSWDGTFEEYREFCREDWEYVQMIEAELENYILRSERGFYD